MTSTGRRRYPPRTARSTARTTRACRTVNWCPLFSDPPLRSTREDSVTEPAPINGRYGTHGRVLVAELTTGSARTETVDESVYRQFLGGYGLGAWLMWKHFPAGTDALSPEACFAIV